MARWAQGRHPSRGQGTRRFAIVQEHALQAICLQCEYDILVLHLLGPERRSEVLRRPLAQEGDECFQAEVVGLPEDLNLALDEGCVFLRSPLARISADAKRIGRLVPKQVGNDLDRTLGGLRHLHDSRRLLLTVAAAQISQVGEAAILVQADGKADLLGGIAIGRRTGQPVIGTRERG